MLSRPNAFSGFASLLFAQRHLLLLLLCLPLSAVVAAEVGCDWDAGSPFGAMCSGDGSLCYGHCTTEPGQSCSGITQLEYGDISPDQILYNQSVGGEGAFRKKSQSEVTCYKDYACVRENHPKMLCGTDAPLIDMYTQDVCSEPDPSEDFVCHVCVKGALISNVSPTTIFSVEPCVSYAP